MWTRSRTLVGEAPEGYAENGTRSVATFRATDPEGKVDYLGLWSAKTDSDDLHHRRTGCCVS